VSIFTQHEVPAAGGNRPQPELKGITPEKHGDRWKLVADEDTVSEYSVDVIQSGVEGTIVPPVTRDGGIRGSDNPYGHVVPGQVITTGLDGKETVIGELTSVYQHITSEEVEEEEDIEDELMVLEKLSQQIQIDKHAVAQEQSEQTISYTSKRKKKQVQMKGTFGSFRGKYLQVFESGEFVVLVYDVEDSIYSPPASQDSFDLICGSDTYTVQFLGIEFEMPNSDTGIQVMVKSNIT